jgi:hypothetical protein
MDLEEDISATLFAGLDHIPVQFFQPGFLRVHHAPLGLQGNKRCNA